jgi:hypothetical protein
MIQKNLHLIVVGLAAAAVIGYMAFAGGSIGAQKDTAAQKHVTLSGTYACLPHADTTGPQTEECAYGFKTDDGTYYALDFGASADASAQFESGKHATLEGSVYPKAALNSDHWAKYQMEGILTVSRVAEPAAQGKLNIDAVCQSALAYMTFPDAASADAFIQECEDGKHPEVIERYKAEMNLGAGAAI